MKRTLLTLVLVLSPAVAFGQSLQNTHVLIAEPGSQHRFALCQQENADQVDLGVCTMGYSLLMAEACLNGAQLLNDPWIGTQQRIYLRQLLNERC